MTVIVTRHKGNVTVLQETEEISLGKCQAYVNSLKRMIYPPWLACHVKTWECHNYTEVYCLKLEGVPSCFRQSCSKWKYLSFSRDRLNKWCPGLLISRLRRMLTRKTRGKFSWIVDYQQGRRFTLGREKKIKCLIFIWNICWPPGLLEIRTKMTFFVTNLMRHVLIMFDTRVTQAAPANAGGPLSPGRATQPSGQTLIVSFYRTN